MERTEAVGERAELAEVKVNVSRQGAWGAPFGSPPTPDLGLPAPSLPEHKWSWYMKNVYLFIYYLIQFCGHSWILTNMTVRFFSFGKDSMIDTFYTIGLVMRLCQSISLLELLHIYVGIESNHLFPRFLQLTERIIILFVVITSQEEIQEKYVVCVLFIFWNLLDMVRYTHSMLAVTGTSYAVLTWLSQTLWMPIYPLCVLAEGMYFTYSHLYSERRDVLRVFSIKKKM
ncbi:very-long-chain (3R)-3-hydroxyacyl-CoA dehydratase 4 isoform X1 [Fukomys damarensis]|uniref:very-long-chain (3R)-3-hydroxyacyl-CoA dehydratase 4 isoform X1 n=1 Tax=Fukomys damarensis TaxID=885580 RepID=UPI00053FB8BE|nr:very-long-chain (3R)-3-hydroxyacyl-CoA dehydratase 4 isoform X1 [Fukomys damarensis]